MNMIYVDKMPTPEEIKGKYPVTESLAAIKRVRDEAVRAVFCGASDKFLLIIGPCSADSREPVLDYISRLAKVQEKVKDKIIIVPRVYTNKPRTTGVGYKGMLHQPDPANPKENLVSGLIAIRELHRSALSDFGFTCADEMLYPDNYRYLDDLLSYVAIGARSVENQQHRLTASGLDIPAGMKNPTEGDMVIMMNSIKAAQAAHSFIYSGWAVRSMGNPYAHAILRGYVDAYGKPVSNYHYEDLLKMCELYAASNLANPAVIVDTNHSNSGKKYLEQVRITKDVLYSRRQSEGICRLVKGLMIESYIEDGAQNIENGAYCYGKSITDPCLGWAKSEKLIYEIADNL